MIKQQRTQKNYFIRCLSLFLISTFLSVPIAVVADPLVLARTGVEMDTLYIFVAQKPKLSATLKIDNNGDMVFQCLNVFSIPVARTPFGDNSGIQKLAQRTRLQMEPKGKGVFIKLTFLF